MPQCRGGGVSPDQRLLCGVNDGKCDLLGPRGDWPAQDRHSVVTASGGAGDPAPRKNPEVRQRPGGGIAATLQQSSAFNATVPEQIGGMDISERYADIATRFDSIRDDAQKMLHYMSDGRIDFAERIQMTWMNVRRGSIPDRFDAIRSVYLDVARAANDQLQREHAVLEAYRDFRMALKACDVEAREVLEVASASLESCKQALEAAGAGVDAYGGGDGAERARLELARNEALRALQDEDKSFQIAKDIADEVQSAYHTAELVFMRLQQFHAVKERLYQRAVTFFATIEVVFTGLAASLTSMAGLHEATETLEQMKDGMNTGIAALASTGTGQASAAGGR